MAYVLLIPRQLNIAKLCWGQPGPPNPNIGDREGLSIPCWPFPYSQSDACMADAYFGHINILSYIILYTMQMVGRLCRDWANMPFEWAYMKVAYSSCSYACSQLFLHPVSVFSGTTIPTFPCIFGKEEFYTCSICNRNRHPQHGGDCMFWHVHVWGALEGHTGIVYIVFLKIWGARLSSKKKKGNAG